MTSKEKTIKELKEALDSLDITNKYRLNLIRAIEYLQEEPVSKQKLSNVQRTVKNCKEPVSEDLSDCINKLSKQFQEVSFAKLSRIAVRVAKWQKEQMMANAIDVEVKVDASGYPDIPQIELYDYDKDEPLAKEGDRVKVIVIKED